MEVAHGPREDFCLAYDLLRGSGVGKSFLGRLHTIAKMHEMT